MGVVHGERINGSGPQPVPISADGLSVPVSGTLIATIDESTLATNALQTSGNASLASIDSKTPASPATAGAQATGNASLSSIDGKLVTHAPWTSVFSTALEASHILKASAGTFRSMSVRLDSTAGSGNFYVQLLNSATLPADGAVTHLAAPVKLVHVNGTDQYVVFDADELGIAASAGMVVVLSSTEFTKTIAGAFLSVSAELR